MSHGREVPTPVAPVAPPRRTLEQIIQEHGPRVYNLARRLLGNEEDARDVSQEVFLQVTRKLEDFRQEADIATWLYRITVNAALAYRKKRARRQEHEISDPLLHDFQENGHHAGPVRPWTITPDKVAVDRETQEIIERAIAQLPELYRDVVVLADIEDRPNAEIAEHLGISVAAVKSRLHRGRLLLRKLLAPYFEEGRPS